MKTKKKLKKNRLHWELDKFCARNLVKTKTEKKKKVFAQVRIDFLRPNSLTVQSQSTRIPIDDRGGGYFPEVESRTQGSRPRPRTQKKSEAKAKDSLSEDRHSRGQGQDCSRPRPRTKDTSASALQKKKSLHKNFSSYLHKKTFSKKFFKRFTKF